jgi:hypothetical protein
VRPSDLRRLAAVVLCTSGLATACYPEFLDNKFGDQHFKTAIAQIELHRLRNGEYPASLKELRFMGDWDKIAFHHVTYERRASGYALHVTNGWLSEPNLSYPAEFWQGIGVVESNVQGVPARTDTQTTGAAHAP